MLFPSELTAVDGDLSSNQDYPEFSRNFKCLNNYTGSLKAVVSVTCSLSMIGSILIILSYFVVPGIRSKAREILVNLSLMDFMVSCSNFIGICMNFNVHLGDENYDSHTHHYNASWGKLCEAQAFFAMYGTISSIIWTIFIAVYIYFRVMTEERIAHRSFSSFYVIAYGLPAMVTIWQAVTHKLGYDHHAASSWCSTVVSSNGHKKPINAVFANDIWVYVAIFLIIIILISLHFHFKYEVKARSHSLEVAVHIVEIKLLFIPVFFILLRIWSQVFIVLEGEIGVPKIPCSISAFFLFASGIGDSGQGFTNTILYVFATPRVRKYFIHLLSCKKTSIYTSDASMLTGPPNIFSERSKRDFSEEFSVSTNMSEERDTKSLLLET